MRKISLSALGLFLSIIGSFAQIKAVEQDSTTTYKPRELKLEEANLVTSYYSQDGNHSAVTGGIGTEKLKDFANTFDLKLTKWTSNTKQHSIGFELGVDTYSSASSDKIDPSTAATATQGTQPGHGGGRPPKGGGTSGASSSGIGASILGVGVTSGASAYDTRIYPSVNWAVRNEKTGITIGANASLSSEYDYQSKGGGLSFTKTSADKSREYGVKAAAFFDTWKVIYPIELRPAGYGTGTEHGGALSYSPRNSFSVAFSLAQIVNKRLQVSAVIEPSYQQGLLATKYQRVYFNNGTAQPENLPDKRWKLPIGLRASYFAGDRVILRGGYRFYTDQWGLTGHTLNGEMSLKLTPFVSISPFYRVYAQNAAKYFAPIRQHSAEDTYFTSDYDLSKLTSRTVGAGVRFVPENGVWGMKHFYMLELRFAHYVRSTDLVSNILTMNMKFK
jgi:Protein of unknown function (DUF3570)